MRLFVSLFVLLFATASHAGEGNSLHRAENLLTLDNGVGKIGIDLNKGGAITHLSGADYPKNVVNSADPGRLIQQSYYAGKRLDRQAEGQHPAWSPWVWNPIQGGGVGSWARVTESKKIDALTLYAETIPKLWDMPNEEAAAVMRQWTGFEPDMPEVVVVTCELICKRAPDDVWGPAKPRHQEVPALYFTRNFDSIRSYLGDGKWREEAQPSGPPWGRTDPPLRAMACFNDEGVGISIFSPVSTEHWNFGPHGGGKTSDPTAGPCIHVAPISKAALGPQSTYRYRYWMILGSEDQVAARLDDLREKYAAERATLTNP